MVSQWLTYQMITLFLCELMKIYAFLTEGLAREYLSICFLPNSEKFNDV